LRKWLYLNRLNSLIRFGTRLALHKHVNHEHRDSVNEALSEAGKYAAVELGEDEVKLLRHLLHEMANVFTGILVTGGLLHQALKGDLRQRYTGEVCAGGERGADLVRQARQVLLAPSERMHV
jgi:hypothetical protein